MFCHSIDFKYEVIAALKEISIKDLQYTTNKGVFISNYYFF